MARQVHPRTAFARGLRQRSTHAEELLWKLLRNHQLGGLKFRRQQPIGKYIPDFVCFEARLIVEADGAHHYPPPLYDRRRDGWLTSMGFTVLRFPNRKILKDPRSVLEQIYRQAVTNLDRLGAYGLRA